MKAHAGHPHAHRGVALITAILLTAIASMIAVSLIARQDLDIRRAGNVFDADRAYVFALGAEGWVRHILDRDDRKKDSLEEDWALTLPPISVEGGKIAGRIEDLQGRFNLNNLVNAGQPSQPDIQLFQRLLGALGMNPDIAIAAVDWADEDINATFPAGAEDDEYSSLPTPYRAANRPFVSPSELRLVKGVTLEIYETLAPYVAALPVRTPINVNTAPAPLLAALVSELTSNAMSAEDAEEIVARREEKSFSSVEDFMNLEMVRGTGNNPRHGDNAGQRTGGDGDNARLTQSAVGVTSEYFLLTAVAEYGQRGKVMLFSAFTRRGGKVAVLWRSQGVF